MNIHQNFTLVSKRSEAIASFRGPLLTFQIVKSIDREHGTLRRWIVFSQGKRSKIVQLLFGKLLWDELNSFEMTIFWHLSEITQERTIYLSLKALALGIPKRLLRKRLESGQIFGFFFITRQQYLSLKGQLHCFFKEEMITLRSAPKYSGYTKHYKDKGSLRPERDNVSEILEPISIVSDEILLKYLTVGEIPLFGGVVASS